MRQAFVNAIYYLPYSPFRGFVREKVGKECMTLLDVGCGPGKLLDAFAAKGRKITAVGVDGYKDYLDIAASKCRYHELIHMDIRNLSFDEDSFDCVACIEVIEHLPKEEALELLVRMERIAKKEIIISTPVGYIEYEIHDGNELQRHKSSWTPEEFRKLGYAVYPETGPRFLGKLCYYLSCILPLCYLSENPDNALYMLCKKKKS